jgi:acetyltransferase-like isoleucine patch superfamily enzyme
MELQEFLDRVRRGAVIEGGSEQHAFMHRAARTRYGSPSSSTPGTARPTGRILLSRLTGQTVDESVTVLPPLSCEFGKNLTLGKDVFITMACRVQDAGGITIGDGTLIGRQHPGDHESPPMTRVRTGTTAGRR